MLTLGHSFYWDDLPVGTQYRTRRRTLTETDLVNFVNLSWLTEELFTNTSDRSDMAIEGRVVPGALVYSCAEGLATSAVENTGLAFLNAELDIRGPTFVGDTIHVQCEVIEQRTTSKAGRGLVRTRNSVVNQHGVTVMTYTPLRLLRMKTGADQATDV